jgi:hypothetical protein
MADARMNSPAEKEASYGRVLIVWVLVLVALYAFQEYFS